MAECCARNKINIFLHMAYFYLFKYDYSMKHWRTARQGHVNAKSWSTDWTKPVSTRNHYCHDACRMAGAQ